MPFLRFVFKLPHQVFIRAAFTFFFEIFYGASILQLVEGLINLRLKPLLVFKHHTQIFKWNGKSSAKLFCRGVSQKRFPAFLYMSDRLCNHLKQAIALMQSTLLFIIDRLNVFSKILPVLSGTTRRGSGIPKRRPNNDFVDDGHFLFKFCSR